MNNIDKAFEYACDRYYRIVCDRDFTGSEFYVEGLLLNYTGGNIVLLSQDGIWHLKYKNIIFMYPIKPRMDRLNEEYKELLELFKGEKNEKDSNII